MALKFTSDELVEIGRRVQDARIAKRMTQEYVAEACLCTPKHISDIERGIVGPSFPIIAKMGKLFDTGVDYYLYNTVDYVSDRMITADISEALVNCDTNTRMYCREVIKRTVASLKPEGEMWRMIIDSGAALKFCSRGFCSRPGQKSVLDKMRYNSYNDREGEVLQERNHSV